MAQFVTKQALHNSLERHLSIITKTVTQHEQTIVHAGDLFVSALELKRTIFFCGNGGSAADAQHIAAELVGRFVLERGPLPGMALTVDTSALTAIGNDYGFRDVFARQLSAHGRTGDVLIALTTSGSSANILSALDQARSIGMNTIVLTGAKGAHLTEQADICIPVPSEETARIQEVHEFIMHNWCEMLDMQLEGTIS